MNKNVGVIRSYDLGSHWVKFGRVCVYAACICLTLIALFPAVWVLLAGFKSMSEFTRTPSLLPSSYNFSVFTETWKKFHFEKYYVYSLISVVGCVVCAVFFNALTAYALQILKPIGSKVINGLVMWSLMIPVTVGIVPLFINVTNMGLKGSFLPIWLCMGANAFYVVLFKQFFRSFPASMVEAARLDGCSELETFLKIVTPLSKSIVMVVVIYAINASWSDFLFPYLVLNQSGRETVMVRLFQFRTSTVTDVDVLRAIVFAIIPPIILFLACSKTITASVMEGGIKE
ncbi:MAG: carbohydrate ABC transporter permease [Sphaerochaetaceae bacterium]|nr:carbohydrate ABC transporter permease [Sphaerochaetaceae bacterium]